MAISTGVFDGLVSKTSDASMRSPCRARDPDHQSNPDDDGAWDVLPSILNVERSGIPVGTGWQPVPEASSDRERAINQLAVDLPPTGSTAPSTRPSCMRRWSISAPGARACSTSCWARATSGRTKAVTISISTRHGAPMRSSNVYGTRSRRCPNMRIARRFSSRPTTDGVRQPGTGRITAAMSPRLNGRGWRPSAQACRPSACGAPSA